MECWLELELLAVAAVTVAGQRADSEEYCFYPGCWNLQQKARQEQWQKVLETLDLT